MTHYNRRRPGRPPKAPPVETTGGVYFPDDPPVAETAPPCASAAPEGEDSGSSSPKPRRRRPSVGGFALKLDAPTREGFVRRWFNDDGNRIAQAEELGYSPVQDTGLKTSSPGSRVSRLTGTKANGEPLHSFLMETPDELYAQGVAEKEEAARTVDEAINRGDGTIDGQMSQIPKDQRYGRGSIRPDR